MLSIKEKDTQGETQDNLGGRGKKWQSSELCDITEKHEVQDGSTRKEIISLVVESAKVSQTKWERGS